MKKQLTDYRINGAIGALLDEYEKYEHAIVHILRHRRQIEIFKIKL